MKRTAVAAAIFAAFIAAQGIASADGYRDGDHRHHGAHFRHMHRHHADWRRAAPSYTAAYYGSRYYSADYDADYGYPPAPRYAYPAYSGCYSGCGPTYPSCYSYGCRPAYSACGYYGGGCGGWMGYSRCGGC
jgi:hypothetical protein